MDTIIKMPAPEMPKIPENLLKITAETMKAGIIVDKREKELREAREAEAAAEAAKKNKGKPSGSDVSVMLQKQMMNPSASLNKVESDDDVSIPLERNYRAHQDRRFGFLLIGDQHRLSGGTDQFLYPSAPPLDFSFCLLNTIEEIVNENEQPQLKRSNRHPVKTEDDRYRTSSLRLSYNVLQGVDDLTNTLYKILDGGPFGLCWLDLSFNSIAKFDDDTFQQLPNLKILYLHGNNIADMLEIPKLAGLPSLKSLTLHGNPIEQEDVYRICVLYYLGFLKHLDFIGVTKGDLATARQFGGYHERHWRIKHHELEYRARILKESQEMSLTQRIMQAEDDDDI